MRTEKLSKAEVVIHPARLRIVNTMIGRQMTTRAIGELLPDLPPASLYRHLKLLKDHGIIDVVDQRSRNGIAESVYALVPGATHFSREEFAAISGEEHQRYFAVFLGALANNVNSYFESPDYDTTRDGMTYFISSPRLTDEHRRRLRADLLELMRQYSALGDPNGRITQIGVSVSPTNDKEETP